MKDRPTLALIALALAGLALVLGPYIYVFFGPLARDPARWAEFGTYAGGVITPLALIATLGALVQNDRHRSLELKRLSNESIKADVIRQIEKVENDVLTELQRINLNILINDTNHTFPGYDILFRLSLLEWPILIPSAEEIQKAIENNPEGLDRLDSRVLAFEVFGLCAAHINRLREYAKALEMLAGHNAESLYLKRKYRVAIERLAKQGFKVDNWDDVAQQGAPGNGPRPAGLFRA